MRSIPEFLAACLLLFMCCVCCGQDDPFGSGADADPFGSGADAHENNKAKVTKHPAAKPHVQAARAGGHAGLSAKPVIGDLTPEAELRIHAALDDETSQTFIKTPLEEAVQQIGITHDIPIVVDRRALEEVGLTPDTPVSLSLRRVTLRSFLRLMLRELELTYMIKDEVMQITTIEAAEQNLILQMYRFPERLTDQADDVVRALTGSVAPDAWKEFKGPCSINVIENVLIVSATSDIHDQVVDFLQKLQIAFE